MLTRLHAIARFDFATDRVIPDRLTANVHRQYVGYAARMLDVYRRGTGRTRRELHGDVRAVFADEPDCPPRRIDAFCKLLDDASAYRRGTSGQTSALRRSVFREAARLHPLVVRKERLIEHTVAEAHREIAANLGRSWFDIERDLFADVIELHRLESFQGFDEPRGVLSRYNVAQQQAALFDAVSMTVWAAQDFKTILRYAKLARLMHTIEREPDGRFRFQFDGPASALRKTTRYGAAMARFLPALIACRDWSMQADLRRPRGCKLRLLLSSADGLTSPLPAPAEFDSCVEETFAADWGAAPRDGWTLVREGDVLSAGQKAFVPDFAFLHDTGRRALLEIVGYWTPEYLAAKFATLEQFRERPILVAIPERTRHALPEFAADAIVYKSKLRVKDVLERLRAASSR